MGKVFVHKPLKRWQLRQLTEEPRPVEAGPGPTVRLQAPTPDPDKEKRAQERLERREAERKAAEMFEHLAEHLRPVVIPGPAFLRWLVEGLDTARDKDAFIQSSNLLTLIDNVEQCIICGSVKPVEPRGSAFLVWPEVFDKLDAEKTTIGAVACPHCARLQPRLYARTMARHVLDKNHSTIRRLCKVKLLEGDRRMLEWVSQPREGNDDRAVDRALRTGVFTEVLEGVEKIIERDNNYLIEKVRKITASVASRLVG